MIVPHTTQVVEDQEALDQLGSSVEQLTGELDAVAQELSPAEGKAR